MTPGSNRFTYLGRSFLLLAISTISIELPVVASAHLEDRIVAIVNSDLIMLSDVHREFRLERERLSREHQGNDLPQRLKTAEYMALTKLIERKLQLQEAKAKKVDVSDQEVKMAFDQMKRQSNTSNMAETLTLGSVRDQLTLMRVVDQHIRGNITVGESELKRYYQEHRDQFAFADEYQLSQILIQPRASDGTAGALEKARRAMDELKKGEKFADVAMQYSDGPNAMQGGRLGLVRQGELLPILERAVARLVTGGISDIIESSEGIHILHLDERKPKRFRPYEAVRLEIQELLYKQKSEAMYQSWLNDLKNKAYIEIKF